MAMRTKEEILLFTSREIEINKHYIDTLKEIIGLLDSSWDNKVLNKRLETYLNEKIDHTHVFKVNLQKEYFRNYLHILINQNEREVYSKDKSKFLGYVEGRQVSTYIETNTEGRILLEQTIKAIQKDIELLEKRNNILTDTIENFDAYMAKNDEMERIIKEYRESVPYTLQLNISVSKYYY